MTIIPVFKDVGHIQPAWSDMFHDSLRRHMIASIVKPKPDRAIAPSRAGKMPDSLARHQQKCAERRAKLTGKVQRLIDKGMSQNDIADILEISRTMVKRIIREART